MQHLNASLFAVGATLAGPWLFWQGFRALRVQQLINTTPTARIRSMAMGLVEVNGTVAPRSRVSAPFSGHDCAYWEIEIATRSTSSRGVSSWTTVHRNRSGHPFYLHDDTGVALVYPQGAECRLAFGVQEETGGLGVPACYMEYMEHQGLGMRGVWALGAMRFRERVLEEGQAVYVLGRAHPKPMSMTVSFDEAALEATGTDSIGARRVRSQDDDVRGVIRRGPQDAAFLITQQSEKAMSFEYGLKAFGGAVAGPALALFGLWCVLELMRSGQLFQ